MIVEKTSHAGCLCPVSVVLIGCQQLPVLFQHSERVIAEHHHLVQIVPSIAQRNIGGCPRMEVQALPESAVIPVSSACGYDGFVGGKGVVVVHAAVCSLQTFRLHRAPDVIIQRCHGVDIQVGRVVIRLFLGQFALGSLIETPAQKQWHGQRHKSHFQYLTHKSSSSKYHVILLLSSFQRFFPSFPHQAVIMAGCHGRPSACPHASARLSRCAGLTMYVPSGLSASLGRRGVDGVEAFIL